MSVAQQIKDRLDIVQYIQEYVPDLKKAGRMYKACCPFHGEKTPSFVVNAEMQSWRCFGACAEGGDIFSFAQKRNGWTFTEALQALGERAGIQVQKQTPEQNAHNQHLERIRGMLQTAASWYFEFLLSDDAQAQQVMNYVTNKRGLIPSTVETFQIGYAPAGWSTMVDAMKNIGYSEDDVVDAGLASRNDRGRVYDRFRNRLMIPIQDERGRVIGFGARALAPDDTPKYLNSPQSALFDKSKTLFALAQAKQSIHESGTAVIVEGYMDAIQAHQAGHRNVVAQMGTAMTDEQLKLLVPRYARKIVLALDADQAGQNATRRSLEVARQTLKADYVGKLAVELRVMQIDGAKDPDDVLRETPEKWTEYVEQAIEVADFVINMETRHISEKTSVQERQQIAEQILPILSASENNIYTRDNVQKLARRVRIDERDLLFLAQQLHWKEQNEQKRPSRPAASVPHEPAQPSYDSSEEPPLFFDDGYDNGTPPADDFHLPAVPHLRTQSQPSTKLTIRSTNREVEGFCLRMMIRDPSLLAQINRRMRELAAEFPHLQRGPLQEFGADDFCQGDYRTIVAALQMAFRQDDDDPIDYLRKLLDPVLIEDLNQMLKGEETYVQQYVRDRFVPDMQKIWEKMTISNPGGQQILQEAIKRALQVRRQRLERENHEIRFLMEEARRNSDKESEILYYNQAEPTTRALNILGRELKEKVTTR
jgi:DNA primase